MIALVVLGVSLASWFSVRADIQFRRGFAAREPLDDAAFHSRYYANSNITEYIPRRLRPIYADFFHLDARKLRPDDRSPDITDFDTTPLVVAIESEFDVTIGDDDAENTDGSFDSIVQHPHAADFLEETLLLLTGEAFDTRLKTHKLTGVLDGV